MKLYTLKHLLATAALAIALDAGAQINVTPAPGEVTELSYFALTFDGAWSLGSKRSAKFVVTGPEGVEIPKIYSASEQSYYSVSFENDAVLTTPGHYTLIVPEGKFAINGRDLAETVFEYDIVEGGVASVFPDYTITPEPGVYKTLAGGFQLLFDTDQDISVTTSGVTLFGGETIYDLDITVDNAAHTVSVMPKASGNDAVLSEAADYHLIFGAKSITVGDAKNRRSIMFDYTITGDVEWGWTGQYTASPTDGSVVESLRDFKIEFEGAGVVRVSDNAVPSDFPRLINTITGREASGATGIGGSTTLNISLYQTISDGGEYSLVVPRKFFKVDGHYPDADIVLSYTIPSQSASFDYSYTLTPADGAQLGAEQDIYLTFAAEQLTGVSADAFAWGTSAPHFTNDFGAYNPTLQVINDGQGFTLTHDWPFESAGTYTLVIPAGFFTLTNAQGDTAINSRIEATYTITLSGIDDASAATAPAKVYDLRGVEVAQPTAPGIYVIDGRKTLRK